MAEVLWTNKEVIKLVKEYQKRPSLWDPEDEYYRTNSVKFKRWSELAEMFKCEVADIRRKVNSILACYRKQRATVKVMGSSRWYLYQCMSFLPGYLPSIKEDKTPQTKITTNETDSESEKAENSYQSDKPEQSNQPDQSDQSTKCSEEEESLESNIIKTEPVARKGNKRLLKRRVIRVIKEQPVTMKSCRLDNKLVKVLKIMKNSDIYRKKDEFDIFGEYIATALRRHDEWTRSMIKQGVNNILFEQDMKKYSRNSSQYHLKNPLEDANIADD